MTCADGADRRRRARGRPPRRRLRRGDGRVGRCAAGRATGRRGTAGGGEQRAGSSSDAARGAAGARAVPPESSIARASSRSRITRSGRKFSRCSRRITLQPLDVAVVELAVPGRRALRLDQALALEEPDLGDRDVRELLEEEAEHLADRQVRPLVHARRHVSCRARRTRAGTCRPAARRRCRAAPRRRAPGSRRCRSASRRRAAT